ncbi:hypothetical protein [Neomoorella thermoacetica]|uniref:hypothetical protein n=1 Tax=Neomoorella thermoacetica TaxID=1525 RepID=UPI0008FB387A|nr:hypothetical protein [Moorella thermoacetica]OIQ53404.1 hypothetical protein MORE_21320 [Moorella thermoacetica]
MARKFLQVLSYFREKYWMWILDEEFPANEIIYALYAAFCLVIIGLLVRVLGFEVDSLDFIILVPLTIIFIGGTMFYFAPSWFASLWIIPALPCALIAAIIQCIKTIIQSLKTFIGGKKKRYSFLTEEELAGGFLDFSGFGGDPCGPGHNEMD